MRALVARLDSFGDVLLAGPAIRAVAARTDRVTLLCGPRGAPAGRLLPGVDEVLVWDAPWIGFDPPAVDGRDMERIVARIARTGADTGLVLTSYHQSPLPTALVLRLAGVGRIAADSVDYPGSLLDVRHRRAPHAHEAEAALDLARAAGFRLPAGDDGRLRVRRAPDVSGLAGDPGYVVVHPGASVPARRWSPRRSAEAVRLLSSAGYRVVVTGSPQETGLTAAVAGTEALDLGGRTGHAELAGVLAAARAVVTGNTGPAHLAAAVSSPVVSLFAPVVPAERWAPYRVPHVLLGDQHAPCAGSRARVCPVSGHPCLNEVTAHDVLAAVEKLNASDHRFPADGQALTARSDPSARPDAETACAAQPDPTEGPRTFPGPSTAQDHRTPQERGMPRDHHTHQDPGTPQGPNTTQDHRTTQERGPARNPAPARGPRPAQGPGTAEGGACRP